MIMVEINFHCVSCNCATVMVVAITGVLCHLVRTFQSNIDFILWYYYSVPDGYSVVQFLLPLVSGGETSIQ